MHITKPRPSIWPKGTPTLTCSQHLPLNLDPKWPTGCVFGGWAPEHDGSTWPGPAWRLEFGGAVLRNPQFSDPGYNPVSSCPHPTPQFWPDGAIRHYLGRKKIQLNNFWRDPLICQPKGLKQQCNQHATGSLTVDWTHLEEMWHLSPKLGVMTVIVSNTWSKQGSPSWNPQVTLVFLTWYHISIPSGFFKQYTKEVVLEVGVGTLLGGGLQEGGICYLGSGTGLSWQ